MKAKKHFRSRALLIFIVCLWVHLINPIQANEKPATTLASTYNIDKNINFSDYWVSEKLDGVRGIWTGKAMITRQGNAIDLPQAIKTQLPDVALDGEIWIARNTFDKVSALVRRNNTMINEWFNDKEGKSRGGIAVGPSSGFMFAILPWNFEFNIPLERMFDVTMHHTFMTPLFKPVNTTSVAF